MQKEKYLITGMTCSACSARVQKAVDKLPGVHEAVVNLLTNSMQIAYDEKQLSPTDIIQWVKKPVMERLSQVQLVKGLRKFPLQPQREKMYWIRKRPA